MSHTADVVIIGAGCDGGEYCVQSRPAGHQQCCRPGEKFHCLRGNRQKLGLYSPTLFDRGHRAHGPAQPGRF